MTVASVRATGQLITLPCEPRGGRRQWNKEPGKSKTNLIKKEAQGVAASRAPFSQGWVPCASSGARAGWGASVCPAERGASSSEYSCKGKMDTTSLRYPISCLLSPPKT